MPTYTQRELAGQMLVLQATQERSEALRQQELTEIR
jgi:hypothetical protein